MGQLVFGMTTAALMVLMVKVGVAAAGGGDSLRRGPLPWSAVVLTALAVGGVALQLSWPGAMAALDHDPAKTGWWRVLTSVFMQNGGAFGALWNVATLALVAVLAHRVWGGGPTLGLFLAGVLLPEHLDPLLGIGSGADGATDPRNFAGSSGATYFLAATLAGRLVAGSGSAKERALAAAVPALGLAMWAAQDNGHGLVAGYGFALGALLCAALSRAPRKAAA
ncbi:hypothetical protein ABZ924_26085 [Streptomyces sp. NPDC046876]|uniref:hypothetical protein n=1 Tax=Streptomyces sp. NPDC046876 TaxID=3155616 RepID=UPI0033D6CBA5